MSEIFAKSAAGRSGSKPGSDSVVGAGQATAHDVARMCGVSHMTVSRVFSGRGAVSEKTRQLVIKTANALGYTPNMAARTMRTGTTHTIGVIVPSANVGMNSLKLEATEEALLEHGYDSAITFTGEQTERLLKALDKMIARRVDGMIISHDHSLSSPKQSAQILEKLNNLQIPFVISDAGDFAEKHHLPGVGIDRGSAMEDLAAHLHDVGKSDVWFWLPDLTFSNKQKRNGFIKAAEKYGLHLREPDISASLNQFLTRYRQNNQSGASNNIKFWSLNEAHVKAWRKEEREVFRNALRDMLSSERWPDVVVTGSDHFAMIAIQELQAIDIHIPDDIAVVGYNNIFEARLTSPPLTTISQPRKNMADAVVNVLLGQIKGNHLKESFMTFPTELVIRESTGGKEIQRKSSINNDSAVKAHGPSLSTVLSD